MTAPFAHCLTSHALSALLFATPAPAAARTSDVSAAVARASALGGSVLMQDTNHPWAVIQDPQGAAFGLIPVVDAVGDLAESLRRVEEEGGTVLKASRGADGSPGYAAVVDPLGVAFALVPGTM